MNASKAKKAATKVRIVPARLKDVSGKMESTVAMKVTIAANWNEKVHFRDYHLVKVDSSYTYRQDESQVRESSLE